MSTPSIGRSAALLALVTTLATALIVATASGTRELIAANHQAAAEQALLDVIPDAGHDNSLLSDTVIVDDHELLGLRTAKSAHLARRHGEVVAVILPATARDGYGGDIDMNIGINRDGSVAGIRVLAHRETPGLGDKIGRGKSGWTEAFIGKSFGNPTEEQWGVKKDRGIFDQFTGATITSRAATAAVKRALQYFTLHKTTLLALSTVENADTERVDE